MRRVVWGFCLAVVAACSTAGTSGDGSGQDGTAEDTSGADASEAADGSDATDASDATEAGDARDGSDAEDVTDAPDATDATDATDLTDGSDGSSATDATDGTDGTADSTDGTGDSTGDSTDATDGTADSTEGSDGTADATDGTDGTADATDGDEPCVVEGALEIGVPVSSDTTGGVSNYEDCTGGFDGVVDGLDSFDGFDGGFDGFDGLPAPDEAWRFEAPKAGVYTFTLTASWFALLYAQTDCAGDQCEGSAFASGGGSLDVKLEAGETLLVVVDGDYSTDVGEYELEVGEPCLPNCPADNECGDDGCGFTCGTCDTGFCQDATCVELPGSCAPIQPVSCGVGYSGLSNTMTGAVMAFSNYSCQQFNSDDYSKSPEAVFTFYSEVEQQVSIGLADEGPLDLIVLEDEGNGCADTEASCVHSASGTTKFLAKADTSYFLILDSADTATPVVPSFDMAVLCCAPSCDGKTCGDDGCGGSCGNCAQGFCSAGKCEESLPSDACEPLDSVTCGSELTFLSNSVAGVTAAFSKYSCQPYISDNFSQSAEVAWAFTAETEQIVTIATVNAATLQLVVLEDLGEGCIDAGANCIKAGYGTLTFPAKAGGNYFLVFDTYTAFTPVVGGFHFGVTCCAPTCEAGLCGGADGCGGTCGCSDGEKCAGGSLCEPLGEGESCAEPFVLDAGALPVAVTNTTLGSGDQFSVSNACGLQGTYGLGGSDHVYAFEVQESGFYTATLDTTSSSVLTLTRSCESPEIQCLGGAYNFGAANVLGTALTAGETVYYVVDSYYPAEPAGPYTLTISPPAPLGPGDSCLEPMPVGELPFVTTGTTVGKFDTARYFFGACASTSAGLGSADQTYSFVAPSAGRFPIRVTADFAPVISVSTSCTDVNGACLAAGPITTSGLNAEVFVDLVEGQEVFIVVDAYLSDTEGAFTLEVLPPCAATCTEGTCGGSDSCGGTCGCADGLQCSNGVCAEPALGDLCANALVLEGELPISVQGDNTQPGYFDDFIQCVGPGELSFGVGDGGNDIVYTFTAPETGDYSIGLVYVDGSNLPSLVSVLSACSTDASACLAGVDHYGALPPVVVSLSAGETVTIIVDSYNASEQGAYTLEVALLN